MSENDYMTKYHINHWSNRTLHGVPRTWIMQYTIGIISDPRASRCIFNLKAYNIDYISVNHVFKNVTIPMSPYDEDISDRLTGCNGYILVYDKNSRASFNRISACCQRLNIIEPNMILVGWNEGTMQTEVSTEEGEQLAKEVGISFFECIGPHENCADKVYKKLLDNVKLTKWDNFRNKACCTIL